MNLRFYNMQKWCKIHLTSVQNEDDDRCLWDRLVGPRPGRGMCEFVDAAVVWVEPDDE